MNSPLVDRIIVSLDAKGRIPTALEVIKIAASAASELSSNTQENVIAVRTALIKILSGPDGELYTEDDVLPERVMRDLVDILHTGMVEQLVEMFSKTGAYKRYIVPSFHRLKSCVCMS